MIINKNKKSLLHRLSIIEGHVRKVKEMVENDKYCIDVLHQNQAVRAALKKVDELVLSNHLNTCVIDAIKKGNKKQVISEVINVFKKTSL